MQAVKFVACAAFVLSFLNDGHVAAQSFSSSDYSGRSTSSTSADSFWGRTSSSGSSAQSNSNSGFWKSETNSQNSGTSSAKIDDFWSKKASTTSSSGAAASKGVQGVPQSSVDANQPWKTNAQMFSKPQKNVSASEKKTDTSSAEVEAVKTEPQEPDYVNSGLPWKETLDGTERGKIGLYQKGANFNKDNSFIFIYYDDFSVNRSLGGEVRCNVRFVVTTTLDRKLNSLSVKLVWPEIETALNFYDVIPNTDTYFYYTLMGEGCYSMDKIPNIVVNRCRVSKMSARDCASKIRWLRKK